MIDLGALVAEILYGVVCPVRVESSGGQPNDC
jgi:hypothetical protein